MDKDKQDQLLPLLKEFFSTCDINKRNVLTRNPVAALLKKELTKAKRWKRLNRGKSLKEQRISELQSLFFKSKSK